MTDAACEAIIRTVKLGFPAERAAMAHAISPDTMRSHKHRHPEFAMALQKAEAEAELSLHARMLRWSEKQWTANAWLMERRWPERYGRKVDAVDVKVSQEVEVKVGPPEPDAETRKSYARKIGDLYETVMAQRNGEGPGNN